MTHDEFATEEIEAFFEELSSLFTDLEAIDKETDAQLELVNAEEQILQHELRTMARGALESCPLESFIEEF